MIRFAILSDIHAYEGSDPNPPSEICVSTPETSYLKNPFRGLERLIKAQGLRAHALLCPGDLGDKSSPNGINHAWGELHRIGTALNAEDIIATVGNHDMASRGKASTFDPSDTLRRLEPQFPGLSSAECNTYWANHFVFVDRAEWRILLVDSAACHGYTAGGTPEYLHGRILDRTLDEIKAELATLPSRQLNILLTHHHLTRHNPLSEVDYSEMQGGDRLLELLEYSSTGEWFIVHGHKHYPRLYYSQGGNDSPIVLAAGSFSANLYPRLARCAQNQFYIVDFDVSEASRLGLGIAGVAHAWNWVPLTGWVPANVSSGIPSEAGFGCRVSRHTVIQWIRGIMEDSAMPYHTWNELITLEPRLKYLLPTDLEKLKKTLSNDPKTPHIG